MNRHGRMRFRPIGAVAVLAATMLVGVINAPVASADVGGSYVTTANASDPFVMKCFDRDTGLNGFCMYTSQDLGVAGPPGNTFPMQNTLGFFSTDGRNWTPKGAIFTESQLPWVPSGARHLWAPAALQTGNGDTFLFVPDVANMSLPNSNDPWGTPNVHTSSRIAIAAPNAGSGAFGPFPGNWFLTDQSGNIPGYMSDPEPFRDSTGQYLLWANGDGDTCGGLSVANLSDSLTTVSSVQEIQITGWPSWGTCSLQAPFLNKVGHPNTVAHPYLEGPSIFKFSDAASDLSGLPGRPYTLVVPAKPVGVPPECSHFGQPGKDTSVLAYATAASVRGPYQYEGLLMCGSSTEWTNQATIAEMTTPAGAKRMVLIYHDGTPVNNAPNRKLHAECLWYGAGTFAMATRTATGFNDCMNGVGSGAWALRPEAAFFKPEAVVSADQDAGGLLVANRAAVGPWEQFDVFDANGARISPNTTGNGSVFWNGFIRSRFDGRAVCAENTGTGYLIANRTTIGAWEKFIVVTGGWTGTVSLTSNASGLEVTTQGNRRLLPTNPARAPDERYQILHL